MAEEFNTDSMLDMFLYESGQLLEKLEGIILEKQDADCFDDSDINEIFRVMHTIKGSSGVLMYENITKVTHKLEDVFYYLRESHPDDVPHMELVEKVLAVSDFVTGELDKLKSGDNPDGDEKQLVADLDEFLGRLKGEIKKQGIEMPQANRHVEPTQFYITPVAGDDSHFYRISIHYRSDTQMSNLRAYSATYALKEVAEDLLYTPDDILSNEASSDVIIAEGFHMLLQTKSSKEEVIALIDSSEAEEINFDELTKQEYGNALGEFGRENVAPAEQPADAAKSDDKEAKKEGPKPGDYVVKTKEAGKGKTLAKNQPKQQSIISVNVEKMDSLMDLIGELVIAEAVVLQNPDLKVPGLELSNFQKASGQLSKITTELQEVIMSMRMMPLTNVFQKMRRIVFDVSRKLGKDIELEVIGENTEVDKNIIEHITDPLMHLVRNSVDHGIEEDAADRTAVGKPAKGKITLEAKNEGGKVYISVKDDGKGLNKEKLYQKALDKGLIDKPMSEFTDKEIFRFITLPGFSTKEQVTEYSGRGVGMDVVVKNIQTISGRLDITSVEYEGSEMTLVIPLTLAIINGIVVQVGNSPFVIETASIKEFVRLGDDSLIHEPSGEEYIVLRGECFPFIRLNEKYDLPDSIDKIEEGIIVVLEHEGSQVCVLIDKLLQEQEIVVKPIPSYVRKVKGLSGCTQLGDGSIALILDIAGLLMHDGERR
ncbi:MAG: chemotaxis protein CheA [Lachnospiraceae bacterium]|nr:chemotaxis protein CheA [Lachnospiraceae bacterium]